MKIVIIGGGHIGSSIARALIKEKHELHIIEQNRATVLSLQSELDAIVLHGDGANVAMLEKAGVKESSLLIAVSDQDKVNVLAAIMAGKINPDIQTAVKVKDSNAYLKGSISAEDYTIGSIINPNNLVIDKIEDLIENPNAIEMINYYHDRVQLIGVMVTDKFSLAGNTLREIALREPLFQKTRAVAIYRNEQIIIPGGSETILPRDKVYMVGEKRDVQAVINKYFKLKQSFDHIIIMAEEYVVPELVARLRKGGRKISVIEPDQSICEHLADILPDITVINGSSTDRQVLNELKTGRSCYLALTDDDEFNIVSSVTVKRYGISKAMCSIRNMALVPILGSIATIDSVFSSNVLTAGETLRICRRGNINSVTHFSEIDAETIEISILDKLPIIGKKLRDVSIPKGMIIASIIRDEQIIVPAGDDVLLMNDRVIVFVLPSSLHAVDIFFSKNLIIGR
jgi:trk system potassium uptake protein TrkA